MFVGTEVSSEVKWRTPGSHSRARWGLVAMTVVLMGFSGSAFAQNPDYAFTVGSGTTAVGGTFTTPVTLDSSGENIQGWSFGVCFDTALATVTNLALGATAQTVNAGAPPDFETLNVEPDGWTMGVVICLTACNILPPGNGYELAVGTYQALAPVGTDIVLCPCGTIGTPVINAIVVVGGQSLQPIQNCGTFNVAALTEFVRGDANDDGFADISDGVWLLNYLFQQGPLKPCIAAADSNADGAIDTADAIFVIFYFFAGGSAPPAPFPTCGTQPNQVLTDCEVFNGCG